MRRRSWSPPLPRPSRPRRSSQGPRSRGGSRRGPSRTPGAAMFWFRASGGSFRVSFRVASRSLARLAHGEAGGAGGVGAALPGGAVVVAEAELAAAAVDAGGLGGAALRQERRRACAPVHGRSEHAVARGRRGDERVHVALVQRIA